MWKRLICGDSSLGAFSFCAASSLPPTLNVLGFVCLFAFGFWEVFFVCCFFEQVTKFHPGENLLVKTLLFGKFILFNKEIGQWKPNQRDAIFKWGFFNCLFEFLNF